jgi:hypothetical protein
MTTLNELYKVSEDWTGGRYCGVTLEWDYENRTCDTSMPGYIAHALQRFLHLPPTKPQHSLHAWQKPSYGDKVQYAPDHDTSPALDSKETKLVQEILAAIGTIATQQASATKDTMKAVVHLLNYCAPHAEAVV